MNKLGFVLDKCISEGECLVWTGKLTSNGYPLIKHHNSQRGNRAVWVLTNGEIPEGLHVLHSCDNKLCLNIKHLSLGTHQENMRQAKERKRFPNQHVTHCPRGHEYIGKNFRLSNGKKACRVCSKEKWRESNNSNASRKRKKSSSKYLNVSWEKRNKKWSARIIVDGKLKRLGLFLTEIEAARAIERFYG